MGPDAPLSDISDEAKQSFEVAVRPVPQYDPENMQMISQGPRFVFFIRKIRRRCWRPGCLPSTF